MIDAALFVRHSNEDNMEDVDHFGVALRSLFFIVLPFSLLLLSGFLYGLFVIYCELFG